MNARRKSLPEALDKVSENQLPDRIAELERQVEKLGKDMAMLKQLSGLPVFAAEDDELEEKKRPGPREKISDDVLFHDRDVLVIWLERYWSWLGDRLLAVRTTEQVKAIFEAVAEEPELRPEWQKRLLDNASALHTFLCSERRKRLPKATVIHALNLPFDDESRSRAANQFPSRQIANAMAGIPDIGWRRSLDRCSAQPSKASVPVSMDMFYRDKYGIDAPKDWDPTGASCPVPKPLQPVLSRSGDDVSKRSQPK